jgi:hypothetical protein
MRLGKFNIFWVGQGNDALKAPHHTRVEGDRSPSNNPTGQMLRIRCRSFEIGGLVTVVEQALKRKNVRRLPQ